MVSEVIMYQSLFVLGILMFGFMSVTFSNYEDFAEETTLASNLEHVAKEVGSQMIDLIKRGRQLQLTSSSFSITLDLILESQYSYNAYSIDFDVSPQNISRITVSAKNKIYANYTIGFVNGTEDGQIHFSGTILSGNANPKLTYNWDSNFLSNPAFPAEEIIFS